MCRFKTIAIFVTLANAIWLTGCASNATKAAEAELKRTTFQRWNACLERNATASKLPAMQVDKLMTQACEGHKRDVIALYPRNLATEVDQMLATSAYRFIESINEGNNVGIQPGKQVQTVLR